MCCSGHPLGEKVINTDLVHCMSEIIATHKSRLHRNLAQTIIAGGLQNGLETRFQETNRRLPLRLMHLAMAYAMCH